MHVDLLGEEITVGDIVIVSMTDGFVPIFRNVIKASAGKKMIVVAGRGPRSSKVKNHVYASNVIKLDERQKVYLTLKGKL